MNLKFSCLITSTFGNYSSYNPYRKMGIFRTYSQIKTLLTMKKMNRNYPEYCFVQKHLCYMNTVNNAPKVQDNISSLQMKKRPLRKKRLISSEQKANEAGHWTIKAVATAEEYNLEGLANDLLQQNLYVPNTICTLNKSIPNVIHAEAKYEAGNGGRSIFFFREGTIVMWNVSELESGNLLQFLKNYEINSYTSDVIDAESEIMTYTYSEHGKKSHLKQGDIVLASDATTLDQYTFSNAIAQSVKLGIWEASLDHYVESIEFVTSNLKLGKKLGLTQEEVLRKQGELFALRHVINLSSDLLDTPDFYWERDDLERIYQTTCAYFNLAKRTRVMNEKLNHCVELVQILSSHLSDRHHIRLEWMIIVLIMVEVAFETLHYVEKYFVE